METHLDLSKTVPSSIQPTPELIPFRFDRDGGIEKGGIMMFAHPRYNPQPICGITIKDLEFGAITINPCVWGNDLVN